MKIRKLYLLSLAASVVAVITFSCDTAEPPVSTDRIMDNNIVQLAPGNSDPKVYVTPATMEYHLANCPRLTEDKAVMLKSEAIAQGYEPCGLCFPPPEEVTTSAPNVYVIDSDNHYHLAGCVLLDDTKRAISKSEAIEREYTACPICNPSEYVPPEPHVRVNPGETLYHRTGCPELREDAILMLKSDAVGMGYEPCKTCYWQTKRIIKHRHGVVIYDHEAVGEPDPDTEYITLKNYNEEAIYIGDWWLTDDEPRGIYIIPQGTVITAGGTWTVYGSEYNPSRDTQGLWLNNRNDCIKLYNSDNKLIDSACW
jgi:hypothetical protein